MNVAGMQNTSETRNPTYIPMYKKTLVFYWFISSKKLGSTYSYLLPYKQYPIIPKIMYKTVENPIPLPDATYILLSVAFMSPL